MVRCRGVLRRFAGCCPKQETDSHRRNRPHFRGAAWPDRDQASTAPRGNRSAGGTPERTAASRVAVVASDGHRRLKPGVPVGGLQPGAWGGPAMLASGASAKALVRHRSFDRADRGRLPRPRVQRQRPSALPAASRRWRPPRMPALGDSSPPAELQLAQKTSPLRRVIVVRPHRRAASKYVDAGAAGRGGPKAVAQPP